MDQAITALGKTGFKGLYAMNDGTAGGAIAAMQAAGIDPKTIPSTGQDAELEAVQRILTGDQFMTVYKATRPEAETSAQDRGGAGPGQADSDQWSSGQADEDQQRCGGHPVLPADAGGGDEGQHRLRDVRRSAADRSERLLDLQRRLHP